MANLHVFGFFGVTLSFAAAIVLPLFAGCSSSSSGGTGGQGGNSVGGAGGGTVVAQCDALRHDEEPPPVTVRLVNHTASDIYIGDAPGVCNGSPPPYTIVDPQGTALDFLNPTPCGWTCEQAGCTAGCTTTATCLQHHATRVAPNATLELAWRGTVLEERKLPAACLGGACEQTCVAWIKPPAVPLTFTGTVWTEMACEFGMACGCTPDASGTCSADYGEVSGTSLQATATLAPGATSVDIVFE